MTPRLLARLLLALTLVVCAPAIAGARAEDAPRVEDFDGQVMVFLRLPPQHYRPATGYGGGAYGDGEGRTARLRIAARLAREHGLKLVSEWPMSSLEVHCFIMAAPAGLAPAEAAERLARDPAVSWSQPLNLFHGEGEARAPNDPLYRAQPAANAWRLAELHQISTGRRVRVAVIDSMVDVAHPDLAGQIETVQNFVQGPRAGPEQHGTGVAGVIAARGDNGVGIIGVAPNARILALRACWETPARRAVCDSLSLARALDYAISRRAQVVNMSLSGPPDPLLARLIDLALSRGAAIVAAYDRNAPSGGFPASHKGVVAVAELAGAGLPRPVLAAPGRDIPTTQPGGRWYLVNGSSYAAAHVSGLFALLQERARVGHSPWTAVVATSADGIDACATLLQRSGPCESRFDRPRQPPPALPKKRG